MFVLMGFNDGVLIVIKGSFFEWWIRLKMFDFINFKLMGLNLDSICYWLCKWK